MKNIDILTDSFIARLDAFSIGCDSLEEEETWDKETYGELDVFCINEFISVILRLIAADGDISEKETEYINKSFGFSYTEEELADIYENCRKELNNSFDERIREDIKLLCAVNSKLTEEFKALVRLICEIVANSDNIVSNGEKEELQTIMSAIK